MTVRRSTSTIAGKRGMPAIIALVGAYIEAPDDVEVVIRSGRDAAEPETTLVLISLEHPTLPTLTVGLEPHEVDLMARCCDSTVRSLARAGYNDADYLLNLANGLREALARFTSMLH